jgi:hypothetical protein
MENDSNKSMLIKSVAVWAGWNTNWSTSLEIADVIIIIFSILLA